MELQEGGAGSETCRLTNLCTFLNKNKTKRCFFFAPVKRPLEQELASGFGEAGAALMRFEDLRDHVIQPGGPLVQGALLLQGDLKVLLQALDHALVTLTHPGSLLLSDTTRLRQVTHHGRGVGAERHQGGGVLPGRWQSPPCWGLRASGLSERCSGGRRELPGPGGSGWCTASESEQTHWPPPPAAEHSLSPRVTPLNQSFSKQYN